MSKPSIYTAQDLSQPLQLTYDEALELLRCGEMSEEVGLMNWGSNYTFLVKMTHQDKTSLAIYKPRIGERPLWDFPDGTLCERETAAYVVSEALGWYVVPPTVLREGTRGIGSLQIFIEHDPQRHYFNFEEQHQPQLQRLAAFDVVCNNADRKGGHCLLDATDRIWGIDHGLTFHPANKLRTVIWDYAGQDLPDEILQALIRFCDQLTEETGTYLQSLSHLLSSSEISALHRRVQRLIRNKSYPLLGAGPNRPWPAI